MLGNKKRLNFERQDPANCLLLLFVNEHKCLIHYVLTDQLIASALSESDLR